MKNLVTRNGEKFIFQDREEGDVVEVSVSYQLGGVNYFTYKQEKRGVFVHMTPVNLEKTETGMVIRGFTISADLSKSGAKVFAKELKRKSEKQIREVAEKVDELAPTWAAKFRENPQDGLREMYTDIQRIFHAA